MNFDYITQQCKTSLELPNAVKKENGLLYIGKIMYFLGVLLIENFISHNKIKSAKIKFFSNFKWHVC